MAALDIHSAPLLRRLLKRVLAGRQAIIITHDVLDALMLADRVVILENGRISEEGPTREVLQRPRSRFAAGLAGLNLMTGTFTGSGIATAEGWAVAGHVEDLQPEDLQPEDRPLDGQPLDGHPRTQGKAAAVAVFPPSAVSVFLSDAHGSPRNSFEVTITDLEPHGDFVRVRAGSLAADITPAASADLGLVPGLTVHFVVKATSVAVYPA
jgi:molybdate transport system ATP-binding protein